MKRICFLLPDKLYRPVGGHKVIYQHANYLAGLGYAVTIANSVFMPSDKGFLFESLRKVYALLRYVLRSIRRQNTCRGWFDLHPSIREKGVWDFSYHRLPKADDYVATDATTSPFLASFPVDPAHKFYFIQGYENWRFNDERLRETYHYACQVLVISNWLKKLMEEEKVRCRLVPNGYDTREFSLTIPMERKERHCVSMLYHQLKSKNVEMGMRALDKVHSVVPDLKVLLFGVYDEPQGLPDYYIYHKNPDLETHRQLNNKASIYVGTSDVEGWGLTVLEAMACGQAVACTDNKGYLEMAVHGKNALVSPVGDDQALASHIIELMRDDVLRQRLAEEGLRTAAQYTLEKSNRLFADCFRTENEQ